MARSHRLFAALLLAPLALMAPLAPAAAETIFFTGAQGDQPALGGHDPVAYWSGSAVTGNPAISTEYEGARFLFTNEANRSAFLADPVHFLPTYGGYCAWAASEGRAAGGNPEVWRIEEGRLLLNCSKEAEAKWLAGQPGTRQRADAWWAARNAK